MQTMQGQSRTSLAQLARLTSGMDDIKVGNAACFDYLDIIGSGERKQPVSTSHVAAHTGDSSAAELNSKKAIPTEIDPMAHPAEDASAPGMRARSDTMTSQMHGQRREIHTKLQRELHILDGCTRLLATLEKSKKYSKECKGAWVELSFCQAKVEALKLELKKLNANVHAAIRFDCLAQQTAPDRAVAAMAKPIHPIRVPMIALATKTTEIVNLTDNILAFCQTHYLEPKASVLVGPALHTLQTLRLHLLDRNLSRANRDGILLYYHQLGLAENRFFPASQLQGLVFPWYDSLKGEQSLVTTVAQERVCTLYNVAALSTQLAVACEQHTAAGLDQAIQYYEEAASVFDALQVADVPTESDSLELSKAALELFRDLAEAQAQECLWYRHVLNDHQDCASNFTPPYAEAAAVADQYKHTLHHMASKGVARSKVLDHVPKEWSAVVWVKQRYFEGLADYHKALAEAKTSPDPAFPQKLSFVARIQRAVDKLQAAAKDCRELLPNDKTGLASLVAQSLHAASQFSPDTSGSVLKRMEIQEAVHKLRPVSAAGSQRPCSRADILRTNITDPFIALGPASFFCAAFSITNRRTVTVCCDSQLGYTLKKTVPVSFGMDRKRSIDMDSAAFTTDLEEDDFILKVQDVDVRSSNCDTVAELINACRLSRQSYSLEIVVCAWVKVSAPAVQILP